MIKKSEEYDTEIVKQEIELWDQIFWSKVGSSKDKVNFVWSSHYAM